MLALAILKCLLSLMSQVWEWIGRSISKQALENPYQGSLISQLYKYPTDLFLPDSLIPEKLCFQGKTTRNSHKLCFPNLPGRESQPGDLLGSAVLLGLLISWGNCESQPSSIQLSWDFCGCCVFNSAVRNLQPLTSLPWPGDV